MSTNYLKAVFWDYPELCDPKAVEEKLQEARSKHDRKSYEWIMARFLERGRFKDTASFFQPEEISKNLDILKVSSRTKNRWRRFLEVYGHAD